jgi:hypothetical protein
MDAHRCVRARDCSSGVYNAQLTLSNALRYSISVHVARPGGFTRSLGCSAINEQLMALCDVSARLNSAADRAAQVFGHVPVLSSDPLSRVWQLLSLCCLPPHERIAALAPSASIFYLLDLLRRRLDSSKLFCRYCASCAGTFLRQNIQLRIVLFSGHAILMFVIMRIFVQCLPPVQFPRLSILCK